MIIIMMTILTMKVMTMTVVTVVMSIFSFFSFFYFSSFFFPFIFFLSFFSVFSFLVLLLPPEFDTPGQGFYPPVSSLKIVLTLDRDLKVLDESECDEEEAQRLNERLHKVNAVTLISADIDAFEAQGGEGIYFYTSIFYFYILLCHYTRNHLKHR